MKLRLTKVPGISGLTPVFQSGSGSFGAAAPPSAVLRVLLSPMVILLLAIAFAIAWVMTHSGFHVASAAQAYVLPIVGSLASQLKETQEKLTAKQQTLHEIFDKAGADVDFNNADVLKLSGAKDSKEVVEKVRALNAELDDLGKKRDEYAEMKKIQEDNEKRRTTPANAPPLPGDETERKERKSRNLGDVVVRSKAFSAYKGNKAPALSEEEGFGLHELKATFLTSSGWAPESLRTGLVVEKATRPIQVLDIIPALKTDMAVVKYMEETTRTQAEAERAENAAYAEDTFILAEQSSNVRSIGGSVPVTDEQLDDVSGVQSYLDQRLTFGCRQRLDGQVIIGDGIAPNLLGIKNKAGIQTQAKGADPAPDAVYKAMVLVRVTGRAFPNAVVMHPSNWQTVRLLRTADGIYIWGSPAEAGPDRIWGIQVVQADADAAGTAYVGDYANFCALYERKGIEVAVGYVNADFLNGRRTIRAGLRVAFVIYRAAAFCTVTGLL